MLTSSAEDSQLTAATGTQVYGVSMLMSGSSGIKQAQEGEQCLSSGRLPATGTVEKCTHTALIPTHRLGNCTRHV